jgi:acyl-CoA thioesterase II
LSIGSERYDIHTDLTSLLALEELDRDLYRGMHAKADHDRSNLFGGQVAAQALSAAAATVPEGRFPHSLHGYFLRPGRLDRPVLLHVDRDRDGRSFSARHVAAKQDGEVIFSMLASFQGEEAFAELSPSMPAGVPGPDGLATRPVDRAAEFRAVDGLPAGPGVERPTPSSLMWVRATSPLPDDRIVQACALTYLSDLGHGFGRLTDPDLRAGGPSLDHSVWFHHPVRADEWLLLDLVPAKGLGGRGLYHGSIFDTRGTLGAMVSQESVLFHRARRR